MKRFGVWLKMEAGLDQYVQVKRFEVWMEEELLQLPDVLAQREEGVSMGSSVFLCRLKTSWMFIKWKIRLQ